MPAEKKTFAQGQIGVSFRRERSRWMERNLTDDCTDQPESQSKSISDVSLQGPPGSPGIPGGAGKPGNPGDTGPPVSVLTFTAALIRPVESEWC